MRICKKFKQKFGTLLLATVMAVSCVPTYVYAENPKDTIVTQVVQKEISDMVKIEQDFNSLATDKNLGDNGKYPFELLGPLVSYAMIIEDMELRYADGRINSPASGVYKSTLRAMYDKANGIDSQSMDKPDFVGNSTSSIISASITALMNEYTKINNAIKTMVVDPEKGGDKEETELYTYITKNSKHIHNILNTFKYIYAYDKQYYEKNYLDTEFIKSVSDVMDEFYKVYGSINQTFGEDVLADKVQLSIENGIKDIVLDTDGDLHPFYLNGVALSSTFIPFMTDLSQQHVYSVLLKEVTGATISDLQTYMSLRKPLYAQVGPGVVANIMSGKQFSGKPITLAQFLEQFNKEDGEVVLAIRKDSAVNKIYNSITISGKQESSSVEKPEGTTEPSEEKDNAMKDEGEVTNGTAVTDNQHETLYDNDPYGYTQPVYIAGLVEDGDINSKGVTHITKETDYLSRDRHYTRVSNFNYAVMYNLVHNSNFGQQLTDDMHRPLSIDIFGNILTESGIVVVPAMANTTYYSNSVASYRGKLDPSNAYSNHIFPENATLKVAYPYADFFNGQITEMQESFSNKYTFATTFDCLQNTADLSNLNYMVKFMDESDLKDRRKGWTNGTKTFSTKDPLKYPSFPIYPYLIGRDSKTEVGEAKYLINKSSFNGLHTKNILSAQKRDNMQQYILNIGHILLSTGESDYVNSNSVGFNDRVDMAMYNLNKYYLVFDKATRTLPPPDQQKHNGTLNKTLMSEVAMQVAKGSKDVNQMLVGEELSDLNFKDGDKGMSVSILSGWGEGMHFGISSSSYLGSVLYTPKLNEIPVIDQFMTLVQPLAIVVAFLGLFGLLLSWRPFGIIPSLLGLAVKSGLYFLLLAIVFKLIPTFIDYAINYPINQLYSNISLQNTMIDLESKEKNIQTSHFESYGDTNTSQKSAYIILAELSMEQYSEIHEMVFGGNFYREFGFVDYFNNVNDIQVSDTMFLKGNKLCMSLDTVFKSSAIKSFDQAKMGDLNNKQYITPVLKQYWYDTTELHYFTPYHLITEHLLYVLNTITTEIDGRVSPLDYGDTYKVTGFLRNYMKSNYYLKTSANRMRVMEQLALDLKNAQQIENGEVTAPEGEPIESPEKIATIIRKINTIDSKLGTNQDFLGIMKFSGIHTNGENERPFGANVSDDIISENNIFSSASVLQTPEEGEAEVNEAYTMKNVKSAFWYNNPYFNKARWQLESLNSRSKLSSGQLNLVVNGREIEQETGVTVVENDIIYAYPGNLTDKVPQNNYGMTNDGLHAIYTPKTVVEFDFANSEGDKVRTYSNGAYVGSIPFIERDGLKLFALNGPYGLAAALNADFYWNQEYNTAMVFFPESSYVNPIGEMYEKVLKVNSQTKTFMNTLYDLTNNISDENLIKVIALNAVLNFNNEFSTSNYPLYPKNIQMESLNFDVFLKQLFVSDIELARSAEANSLYNYIAKVADFFGVLSMIAFEALLVVCVVLRDSLLAFHSVALPLLFVAYYIFSNRYFYKPWIGTLICFIGVALTNTLMMMLLMIPNSMTSASTTNSMWAILISIVIVVVSTVAYATLWYFIFKDIHNLGYVQAKGMLKHGIEKMSGKLNLARKDKQTKQTEDEDSPVVSERINEVVSTTASRMSSLDRYQRDIDASNRGVISSRISIDDTQSTASSVRETLGQQEDIAVSQLDSKVKHLSSVDYADYSRVGAPVTRTLLNQIGRTTNLFHGKDYEMIGDTPFVTNPDIISRYNLKTAYSVVGPATKDVMREITRNEGAFERQGDTVKYISSTPEGVNASTVSYENGKLEVPLSATKTVKDYLTSQGIDFTSRANKFSIRNTDRFTQNMQDEIQRISKPVRVVTKEESRHSDNYSPESGVVIVPPDSILREVKQMSNRVSKMESRLSKREASTINSKAVKRLFRDDEQVYTYSLHLDKDESVKPLVNDLYQIANNIESNLAQNKALTLRTTDGVSVVFETKEDYENFKKKFTEATSDYFVRPTVYKSGDKVSVYTLNGNSLETHNMTEDEFKNSTYSLQNYKKLN